MSKRRAHVTERRGRGGHAGKEPVKPNRPTGPVTPVQSRQRHGRPVEREVSDVQGREFAYVVALVCFLFVFVIGGGISKDSVKFLPLLTIQTPVVPAQLLNDAGIVGAALGALQK